MLAGPASLSSVLGFPSSALPRGYAEGRPAVTSADQLFPAKKRRALKRARRRRVFAPCNPYLFNPRKIQMKRSSEVLLFAVALAVAALVPALNAQDNPPAGKKGAHGPRGGMPRPIEMLIDHRQEIGLSDDQVAKLKALQEATRPQVEAIMQDQSLSREDKREKMQAIMKDSRAKIDAILTPEQREKAKEFGGKMREGRGKGPRGHGADKDGPPPPPAK